jgi:hypothetical protein
MYGTGFLEGYPRARDREYRARDRGRFARLARFETILDTAASKAAVRRSCSAADIVANFASTIAHNLSVAFSTAFAGGFIPQGCHKSARKQT